MQGGGYQAKEKLALISNMDAHVLPRKG